jgi:hypothetical protein
LGTQQYAEANFIIYPAFYQQFNALNMAQNIKKFKKQDTFKELIFFFEIVSRNPATS